MSNCVECLREVQWDNNDVWFIRQHVGDSAQQMDAGCSSRAGRTKGELVCELKSWRRRQSRINVSTNDVTFHQTSEHWCYGNRTVTSCFKWRRCLRNRSNARLFPLTWYCRLHQWHVNEISNRPTENRCSKSKKPGRQPNLCFNTLHALASAG